MSIERYLGAYYLLRTIYVVSTLWSEGMSIFLQVGKHWQEIHAFCRNTLIF